MRHAKKKITLNKTAEEVEKAFDNNISIFDLTDEDFEIKKVNVDFPTWIVKTLDDEAQAIGIPRQALIKIIIAKHCDDFKKTGRLKIS